MPRNPIATRSAARTVGSAAARHPGARQKATARNGSPTNEPRYSNSPEELWIDCDSEPSLGQPASQRKKAAAA